VHLIVVYLQAPFLWWLFNVDDSNIDFISDSTVFQYLMLRLYGYFSDIFRPHGHYQVDINALSYQELYS